MTFRFIRHIASTSTYQPCTRTIPRLSRSLYTTAANTNAVKTEMTDAKDTPSVDPQVKSAIKTESSSKKDMAEKEEKKEHGYAYGAHHWNMERGAAITLIPLVSTSMLYGAHPIVDGLMGVVLPYHIYMGFDSCITDYVPKRVYPRLHRVSNWINAASTGLVMWGCYEFNTNDIGITEFMQRLFTA